jgi:two-component system chemotaxis sensor kinase CheA
MSKKYLDIFCKEAEEHLASLQSGLLVLEKNPGRSDLLQELLRNAHTLKGSARLMSMDEISAITHSMEEQLQEMQQGTRAIDAVNIDLLLKGADEVAVITAGLYKDEPPHPAELASPAPEERIEATPSANPAKSISEQRSDTVRADVKTLDGLVNLIGEMIINKKRLEVKLSRLKAIAEAADGATAELLSEFRRELEDDVLYLDYLIQELHEKAMGLRMLPLSTITEGFERLVRDLSQKLDKQVKLEMTGWSIRMDRVLLEGLKPMLIHLLTNAVYHGIETPARRQAAGKDPQGSITLTARQEGSSVTVSIRDDGKGMDPALIKATALASGLIDRHEAKTLGDEEALYLTLRPGFTTVDVATDVAGRGVGMDVVKKSVDQVKGNLSLTSKIGSYSEVALQLPLTLSVMEALMIEAGGETFAIPINYLQEIIKVREEDIATLGAKETIKVRGVTTPLYSLSGLLGLPRQPEAASPAIAAVVLRHFDQRIACTVDAQLGNSVVVVKGLGAQFAAVKFVFGATILGDGNPALILNVPDLLTASCDETRSLRHERPAALSCRGKVLVVDDSITTRTMEQSILATQGYQVQTAVSGEDALEKSAAQRFDLIISDVEMPGINGFQLTRLLRATEEYRDTPIIVVSSLSRDEDKRQAMQAGAQAYIVKGAFDQGLLLDTVQMLIG